MRACACVGLTPLILSDPILSYLRLFYSTKTVKVVVSGLARGVVHELICLSLTYSLGLARGVVRDLVYLSLAYLTLSYTTHNKNVTFWSLVWHVL